MNAHWLITALVGLLVSLLARLIQRSVRREAAAQQPPGEQASARGQNLPFEVVRLRAPRTFKVLEWAMWAMAAVLLLLALMLGTSGETTGLVVCSIVGLIGLAVGLLYHRLRTKFWIEEWPEGLAFGRLSGREGFIRYREIDLCRFWYSSPHSSVTVKDVHGTKFNVTFTLYPVDLLLANLAFREQFGRWPLDHEELGDVVADGILQEPSGKTRKHLAQPDPGAMPQRYVPQRSLPEHQMQPPNPGPGA